MLGGHNQVKCRNSLIHRAGNVMMMPFIHNHFFYSSELIFIYLDSDPFFLFYF